MVKIKWNFSVFIFAYLKIGNDNGLNVYFTDQLKMNHFLASSLTFVVYFFTEIAQIGWNGWCLTEEKLPECPKGSLRLDLSFFMRKKNFTQSICLWGWLRSGFRGSDLKNVKRKNFITVQTACFITASTFSVNLRDPTRRPPAFSIIPTDPEPGTGHFHVKTILEKSYDN